MYGHWAHCRRVACDAPFIAAVPNECTRLIIIIYVAEIPRISRFLNVYNENMKK